MALKRNTTPEPVTPDEYDSEGEFSTGVPEDENLTAEDYPDADGPTEDTPYPDGAVIDVPAEKKVRKQTKAGRLGAAEKAVEKAKAKQDKISAQLEKLQEQNNEAFDAYEEAQRELGEALSAFGISTTRATTPDDTEES